MQHSNFCERCDKEWHTYCSHFHEEHTPEEKLEEDRERFSGLCHGCWTEYKKNPSPIFELAFHLNQKEDALRKLIWTGGVCSLWGTWVSCSLDGAVESMLVQTPEKAEKDKVRREKQAAENKKRHEEWEAEWKYFQENGKWPIKQEEL